LTTWQYIPEDSDLHVRCRDNLKSHTSTNSGTFSINKGNRQTHTMSSYKFQSISYILSLALSNDSSGSFKHKQMNTNTIAYTPIKVNKYIKLTIKSLII
jgi:hypothetical protein